MAVQDQSSYKVKKYFEHGVDVFLPHLSINYIVFGFDNPNLKILVQRLFNQEFWLLPGGYIYKNENVNDAAYRNLKLSGLHDLFLRQFKTFGEATRVTKKSVPKPELLGISKELHDWVTQRFVTVGYYALVDFNKVKLQPGLLSNECTWLDINELDDLAMDHADIVREARGVLSEDLLNFPVVANLLPDSFTIPELKQLYESILDRSIDRGTFRKKTMKSGILEKVGKRRNAARRPPDLYKLNQEQYIRSLMKKTRFGF